MNDSHNNKEFRVGYKYGFWIGAVMSFFLTLGLCLLVGYYVK